MGEGKDCARRWLGHYQAMAAEGAGNYVFGGGDGV